MLPVVPAEAVILGVGVGGRGGKGAVGVGGVQLGELREGEQFNSAWSRSCAFSDHSLQTYTLCP